MQQVVTYIERQNSLKWRILAALFYTIALGLIIYFLVTMDFSYKEKHFYAHFDIIKIIFPLIFLAIYFSYNINCFFDFEKKLFKREFTVGIFRYGKWRPMPKFDYISLFAINEGTFQVNLWSNKNKHWDLYEEFNFKDAFLIAFELSELLKIDLLDATVRNNFRWVDKKATIESGEMKYLN